MLLFKKKFLAAIREGSKTQTIRLWKHRRMRAGQVTVKPGYDGVYGVVKTLGEEGATPAETKAPHAGQMALF